MPDAQPLTRGKVENQAINAGANFDMVGPDGTAKIPCGGDSTLVVMVDMTGGAAGDLALQVNPIEADNTTVVPEALPPVQQPVTNPTLSGGHVFMYQQFDVSALEYVRIRITNNNAGAQTITRASWRLS